MEKHLRLFQDFLLEAKDPTYYQDTFYFTILISMTKDLGGSRDETKNDIRALPEVLTVTLVEPEKGGIQRDIGTKYLSTLKVHVRKPKDVNKKILMRKVILYINNLRGVAVLRYKEAKPKQRRKAFHGQYKITEGEYYQTRAHKTALQKAEKELTQTGPNSSGPYKDVKDEADWESAPPGAPGGLEEAHLDEAMKTGADLPEDIVVVIDKDKSLARYPAYQIYYARKGQEGRPLKRGDMDRMERDAAEGRESIFGVVKIGKHVGAGPHEGVYLVSSANTADGYGPLLYDVAMELAGNDGLKPDVDNVSDDAAEVWKYYDSQRSDVEASMLVDDEYEYEEVMPPNHAAKGSASDYLAKAYYMAGSSPMDLLGDKLVRLDKENPMGRDYAALYEDVVITIGAQTEDDLLAFDIQGDLQPKLWKNSTHLYPGVKAALMEIVDEFVENLGLDVDIADIIVTGSIANYNWSKFSDIDVHILVDFDDINTDHDLVKRFFDAVRSNWNKLHDIRIKGHEVELYVQDINEPHISTGVYSLPDEKWLVTPKKIEPQIDKVTALKKMKSLAREVDKLSAIYDNRQYEEAFKFAERIKEKIKRMRQSGLQRSGIYSPENLAFKMLRRSGDIEQLFAIYTQAYDQIYSLDQ